MLINNLKRNSKYHKIKTDYNGSENQYYSLNRSNEKYNVASTLDEVQNYHGHKAELHTI